jgi:hypothetical protein
VSKSVFQQDFATYEIAVKCANLNWTVWRRYSQFHNLRAEFAARAGKSISLVRAEATRRPQFLQSMRLLPLQWFSVYSHQKGVARASTRISWKSAKRWVLGLVELLLGFFGLAIFVWCVLRIFYSLAPSLVSWLSRLILVSPAAVFHPGVD